MLRTGTDIYLTAQISDLEHLAGEKFHLTCSRLMQRAGKAAFDLLKQHWPHAKKIAVFCGSGHNGGDGYVLATLAAAHGLQVTVWQVGNHESLSYEVSLYLRACQEANIDVQPFHENISLKKCDLIIDAICGTGAHHTLRDSACAAIEAMTAANVPIFSLDVPSGVHADTGNILGAAVSATLTLTFIGMKLGLITADGAACTGELFLNDLQLPASLFELVKPVGQVVHLSPYKHFLKPRPRNWHKKLSGSVLVIGGSPGFAGAARMAAEAALRVGAGLVSIATHPYHAASLVSACPEIMCHAIESGKQLLPLIDRADVIVLGPGLGLSDWSFDLWETAIQTNKPTVLDADGLNWLAEKPFSAPHWILTPHPGEAARLLQTTADAIQSDRLTACHALQQNYGGTIVLKGAGTFILGDDHELTVCDRGNPGMASAGMGDVLSGVIASLVGQNIPAISAANLGVYLHASAGDLAAKKGERGLLATDLMPYLHQLCNFPT